MGSTTFKGIATHCEISGNVGLEMKETHCNLKCQVIMSNYQFTELVAIFVFYVSLKN